MSSVCLKDELALISDLFDEKEFKIDRMRKKATELCSSGHNLINFLDGLNWKGNFWNSDVRVCLSHEDLVRLRELKLKLAHLLYDIEPELL